MFRLLLYVVLLILLVRALSRLWTGIVTGATGGDSRRASAQVPQRGVQMARDPVCGIFVVPEQSVTLQSGREKLYFCSTECRDAYVARDSGGSRRSSTPQGHTA